MTISPYISPVFPIKGKLIFRGDEGNSFLAPRGIFVVNDKLIVSDTGQNRVFIWNEMPKNSHQPPDVVLGQTLVTSTGRNQGRLVDASSLQYPSGLWSDGTVLIVADAWNHRVLIWHTFPTRHGQPADVVIGQPDFFSNDPNLSGIGKKPSAKSLYWPYGVWAQDRALWVADTGNRRVLWYENIPQKNFQAADKLIGAENFDEKDYNSDYAVWPYSVKVNSNNHLAITDTQYFRTMIWNNATEAFSKPCDVIIGQADSSANGQNQYQLKPAANTLSWCYDSHFHKNGIWVADTGNSRLLFWKQVPLASNMPADFVLGHQDFQTSSENQETIHTTENSLYWPFAISTQGNHLAVADTGNHRIMLYHLNDTIY